MKKISLSKLYQKVYHNYPNFVNTWKNRSQQYNEKIEKMIEIENKGNIFVRPSRSVKIKRLKKNPLKLQELYHLGVSNMKEQLQNMSNYLQL